MELSEHLDELDTALEVDDPIFASDEDLLRMARIATEELRRRMPRYALDAGDLEPSDEEVVDNRERAAFLMAELR